MTPFVLLKASQKEGMSSSSLMAVHIHILIVLCVTESVMLSVFINSKYSAVLKVEKNI